MTYIIIIMLILMFVVSFCQQFKRNSPSQGQNSRRDNDNAPRGEKIMQCPNCGATLHIKPDATQWECGWCGNYGKLG